MIIPIIFIVLSFLTIVLIVSLVIFLKCFYARRKKVIDKNEYSLPKGKIYEPYYDQMRVWIKELRAMPHTDVEIRSYDGLVLRGKYYEHKKGAPIEVMFHGYRSNAERDLCGGVHRCFKLGRNALLVDQRGCGDSEGRVTTFGVKESRDCVSWVNFVVDNIDREAQIYITGISMGAATVMTAASMSMPKNVVGVLADCGFTSPREIIKKVMKDLKLPANLLYPFARLGAIIFGGFDPDSRTPEKSMKNCRLPIIFYHGDNDQYVPCYMSEELYNVCTSEKKRLVVTKGAGHGLCFIVDTEGYFRELNEFFG